jgi:signal transduction histidine kinase
LPVPDAFFLPSSSYLERDPEEIMEARPAALRPDFIQLLDRLAAGARDPDEVEPFCPTGLARLLPIPPDPVDGDRGFCVVTTLDGREPRWNPRAQSLSGYSAADGKGQSLASLVVSEQRDPATSPNGLEKHGAALAHQRKAARAEFAAMVAHELTSPIAAIRCLTGMVMAGGLPPEEQTYALSAISRETEVLQALIVDLESAVLSESDDFVVKPRPTAVSTLLTAQVAFARTLSGEHPLTTKIDCDQRVRADPQRIGQVLRNLIDNASKYSPRGAPIELRAAHDRDQIRIEVIDRGPGIPPVDRHRIFEKFERGHTGHNHGGSGLGLGLYLSRRLVQMHGSELTVEQRPGGGSIFGFALEIVL